MRQNSKRNRQLIRDSIHLPFYERISSRNGSTANSSDVDPNELQDRMQPSKHRLGNIDRFSLSEDIIKKCQKAFNRFDVNNDGAIDIDEMTKALVAMGFQPTEEEVAEIMDDVDQDGNDRLDLLEFMRVIQRQKDKGVKLTEEEKQEINIQEAWKVLKSDNSNSPRGHMDVSKFKKTLRSFDLAIDIDSLVRAMDINESGLVDFDEFHGLFSETQ